MQSTNKSTLLISLNAIAIKGYHTDFCFNVFFTLTYFFFDYVYANNC